MGMYPSLDVASDVSFCKLINYITQGKFDEFISPDEGLLRETCKSQNINPILSSP